MYIDWVTILIFGAKEVSNWIVRNKITTFGEGLREGFHNVLLITK